MTTRPSDHGCAAIHESRSSASSTRRPSHGSKTPSEWQRPRQSTASVATPHSSARSGDQGLPAPVASYGENERRQPTFSARFVGR